MSIEVIYRLRGSERSFIVQALVMFTFVMLQPPRCFASSKRGPKFGQGYEYTSVRTLGCLRADNPM